MGRTQTVRRGSCILTFHALYHLDFHSERLEKVKFFFRSYIIGIAGIYFLCLPVFCIGLMRLAKTGDLGDWWACLCITSGAESIINVTNRNFWKSNTPMDSLLAPLALSTSSKFPNTPFSEATFDKRPIEIKVNISINQHIEIIHVVLGVSQIGEIL